MTSNSSHHDVGIILRRSLFFVVLAILTLGNLLVLFKGLNTQQAMDQAQISREIARGNGFTTKMIRPAAYSQMKSAQKSAVSLVGFQDTYHSPLSPLLNAAVIKLIGADSPDAMQMTDEELVFPLDRVIATISTLFFLMAIGVNYLLITRIFDAKIAAVCAILMLFSETFWGYAMSGLPQMLMLLLFSCAIYFVYRAVEATEEGKIALVPAMVAGVFFTLLALTHWMAVWIALGYIIFAAIAFRPRGIVGLSLAAILALAVVGPMIRNQSLTDSPFGTAFLTLYNGLGSQSESSVMRTMDLESASLIVNGLVSKIARTTLLQMTEIIPLLAGIVVAPLFFIALLHPFKRAPIANFRWAILLMWVATAFGLAFFGVSTEELDPNQLHLLFAPIMAAYGLAFISILWSRLDFVATAPLLQHAHYIVIVLICALPLASALPSRISLGMQFSSRGGLPSWPPYYAVRYNSRKTGLKSLTTDRQVIFSDQPWAVAWYADRISIWLPPTRQDFDSLDNIAAELGTPVAGVVISPSSHGDLSVSQVAEQYKDFASMVLDGNIYAASGGVKLYEMDPKLESIAKRFRYRRPLVGLDMIYYSERPLTRAEEQ